MALVLGIAIVLDARSVGAWGIGHRIISQGAYAALPAELQSRWGQTHRDSESGMETPIAVSLTYQFCMIPDQVDGPSRDGSDIGKRKRATKFLYAERKGEFFPPLAYADPDRDKSRGRPKTYHYFTYPTEELNRTFCLKGARWYFGKISAAFRAGDNLLAAEYAGAFAHAIQDRVSPYHVWDGYSAKREALEEQMAKQGLQLPENSFRGNAAGASLFWTVSGAGMTADLGEYRPGCLGASVEEAAIEFTKRLFANREYAEKTYTEPGGFIAAHLQDDWQKKNRAEKRTNICQRSPGRMPG